MQDARLYAFPSSLAGYFSPWMGQQFNLIDDITHLGGRGAQNFFFFQKLLSNFKNDGCKPAVYRLTL